MTPALEAFFQAPRSGHPGQRLYLHHPAAGADSRAAVLYLHPFAEAMNKSRRMAALQSRALAAAGFDVLQVDLLGCGDSSGELADASWEDWVQDALDGAAWLARRHPGRPAEQPTWLWGHREGALLAAAAAARMPEPVQLLLWQPVLQGRQALQQFLRLKAAAQLADGGGKGVVEGLRAELAAGRTVEVAGYTLGPALAQGLESAVLTPPPVHSGPTDSPPRAVWLEVNAQPDPQPSPAAQAAQARWLADGWALEQQAVAGPAFWQTQEIEDAPALVEATLAALSRPGPVAVAGAVDRRKVAA
jgi:exosortase A-associated hydrolase 2